jgi:hypothetical protein
MSDKNEIIEKIKKIMRLAQNAGATEGEAAAAMSKVQEILAQHNLDMSQIDMTDKDAEPIAGHRGRVTNKNNKWEIDIFAGAAKLNFCSYYTINIGDYNGRIVKLQHVVVGKPVNVMATELLVEYLLSTVNKMAKEYSVTGHCILAAQLAKTSIAMAVHRFKQGMARQLRHRCIALVAQRSAAPTKTSDGRNLPALADAYEASQKEIQAFIQQNVEGLVHKTHNLRGVSAAFGAGKEAANTVNLDKQIGGTTSVPSGFRIGSK